MNIILFLVVATVALLMGLVGSGRKVGRGETHPYRRGETGLYRIATVFMAGVIEALTLPSRLWARIKRREHRRIVCFANIAEGKHLQGKITRKTDAVIATRYLLVKYGTDATHIDIAGAADLPLGVCIDEAVAIGDKVGVELLGPSEGTQWMVASEAIAAGATVYTAASGKIQDEPAVAGTYYLVGIALQAAGADGDRIEVQPTFPRKLTVIATLGNTNGTIAALAVSNPPTQAEVQALRAACETLGDDLRALGGACAAGNVKVL